MNETIFTPSTNQSQMTENHLRKLSKIKTTQPQKMCARASPQAGEGETGDALASWEGEGLLSP
jgi:hypothetical protein